MCPDWPSFKPADKVKNAKGAMDLAEKWLDIPQVRSSKNGNDKFLIYLVQLNNQLLHVFYAIL